MGATDGIGLSGINPLACTGRIGIESRQRVFRKRSEDGMTPQDLFSLFKERGALLDGHFLLSSGLHSSRYLQCARVLMDPVLATRLGSELAQALRTVLVGARPDAVVAPALGGVIVAHEVARELGCRGLFTERQEGTMTLRRGFRLEPGEGVVVVEDVITTGASTREVMEAVRSQGARVLAAGSLVDRGGGALDLGAPRRSLPTHEVPSYPADECPLCAQGRALEKPGSRPPRKG
jgi:orotate phosphoribosyltransferase